MRLTPAQIGVRLICGNRLPPFGEARIVGDGDMKERIKIGHDWLVRVSGKDFGYDLAAWHRYLKESRDGGYTWARTIVLPRIMESALASGEWREAVRQIQAKHAKGSAAKRKGTRATGRKKSHR
jgi:hypothetical protein